jgi:hypothetical protein
METITTDNFLTAYRKRREKRDAELVMMYLRLRKIYPDISDTRMYEVMEEHGAGASVTTIRHVMQANGLTRKWPGRGHPKGLHKKTTK